MNTLGFWHNPIVHAVIIFLVFCIPFLVDSFPTIANLTIGGIATFVVAYLKQKALVSGIKAGSIRIK